MASSQSSWVNNPLDTTCSTTGKNLSLRVGLIGEDLALELRVYVTTPWLGWLGRRALMRNYLQRRVRCSSTGMTLVSWCRWGIEDNLCEPEAILRAVFCVLCSLAIEDGEEFGNQIGAA